MKLLDKLSRPSAVPGTQVSLKGYLSREEFMRSLNKALKSSSIWGFVTFVLLALAGDFEKWYIGPYAMEIATFVALVRGYFAAKNMGAKYAEQGVDPRES
jgi:hypothetical protein